MQEKLISIPIFCVVLVFGLSTLANESIAGSEEDVAAINKVLEMEVADVNEPSFDSTAAIFAPEIVFMQPGMPALNGTDAVATSLIADAEKVSVDIDYTSSDIKVLGDWAIESYAGTVVGAPREGGDSFSANFKGIHVFRRDADGNWKITHDIWNYDSR